ncbi:hypothetical protein AXF42_Ash020520 [Apostasia shenzhenica]|uniref:Uncharacterized protein n=1 Tax=Apostasia shenzhenica TaxID=1088818 RepID=A0A2I0BCT0_9ASPA|nr:hypothetical protein AXF42_Ash020520 [Apostasia shenzhenica]
MGGKKKKICKEGNRVKPIDSGSIIEAVNQTKPSGALSTAGVVLVEERDSAPEQNHHSNTPSFADNQSAGVSESDVEQERYKSIEAELQEEVKKLKDEKKIWLQKEACWEEKLKVLQHEVVSCIQIKTNLEEKIDDLQNGNASLILKVSSLEGRVMKMEDIDESWQLKENVIKERLTSFVDANEDLQMQVYEAKTLMTSSYYSLFMYMFFWMLFRNVALHSMLASS